MIGRYTLEIWFEHDTQLPLNLGWIHFRLESEESIKIINRISGNPTNVTIIREHSTDNLVPGKILAYLFNGKHFGSEEALLDYVRSSLKITI
jgi:hypothetical protein